MVVVGEEEGLTGAGAPVVRFPHLSVGATFSLLPSTESEKNIPVKMKIWDIIAKVDYRY